MKKPPKNPAGKIKYTVARKAAGAQTYPMTKGARQAIAKSKGRSGADGDVD